MPSARPTDLDRVLLVREYLPAAVDPDTLAANGRTPVEQMASVHFAGLDGTATAAGLVTVGVEPTRWIPGAYVQFLRLEGDDLAAPIVDEKRLDGPLPDILRQLDEVLRINIATRVDITSSVREERRSDYPLAALQQLARNAVMHRDYETSTAPTRITWYQDRIEVLSPGGPYGSVTPENFGTPGLTDYRTPRPR